ncbi:Hsp70 family protein [Micromonospora sp. NPDC003197]
MRGLLVGIDFGTSNTVAMLRRRDGRVTPLLFDGTPLLSSAVFAAPDGTLIAGREATHGGRVNPERYEPNPKQRIDDEVVLLGDREVPVVDLVTTVLARVHAEATRAAGEQPEQVVLTHPASWGEPRRQVLAAAAAGAGMAAHRLVPEPVAAAGYFVDVLGSALPMGACLVVYDLGAGTFDVAVVRRESTGYQVLAERGLPDAGGLDVDAAIIGHLGTVFADRQPGQWRRLTEPATTAEQRARRLMWEDVRAAKEVLSRSAQAVIPVPLLDQDALLGREQLEQLARPLLDRTVEATRAAVHAAGLTPTDLHGILLVGGSSRIPLVSTLLMRAFSIAPVAIEQPELVVAEGAVVAAATQPTHRPATVPDPSVATTVPEPSIPAMALVGAARPSVAVPGRRSWPVRVVAALFAVVALVGLFGLVNSSPSFEAPDDPGLTVNGAPLSWNTVVDLDEPMVLSGSLGAAEGSQVTEVRVSYRYFGFWLSTEERAVVRTEAGRWTATVAPPSRLAGLIGGALELSIELYDETGETVLPFGLSPQYVQLAAPRWSLAGVGALLSLIIGGLVIAVLLVRGARVPPAWTGIVVAVLTVPMWTFVLFVVNLTGKPEEVAAVLGIGVVECALVALAVWRAWRGRGGPVPLAAAVGAPIGSAWWLGINCLNQTSSHAVVGVETAILGALVFGAVAVVRTGQITTRRAIPRAGQAVPQGVGRTAFD